MRAAIRGAEAAGSGFVYQPPPPLPLPLPLPPPLSQSFVAGAGASSSGAGSSAVGGGGAGGIASGGGSSAVLPFISNRQQLEQADAAFDTALDAICLLKNEEWALEPPPRPRGLEELMAALRQVSE